ncbi:PP2C family protein-serine/threonine phosphatase [Herbiconiux liangxiaofengii]|uniref:PP2C family protein-serine/threonine phosphatase n=1 Tax=Herbiconiux liangxiaofengii TaxID=3342795 RepID=UPI0035BB7419
MVSTKPDAGTTSDDRLERLRVAAVESLSLLDTPAEERFDRITRIARELFGVPVAEINLLDDTRQFTKSPQRPGISPISDRTQSFCDVAIQQPDVLVVPDATEDDRFSWRSTVTGERHIRFYAGAPLSLGDDFRLGTLCLVDTTPREFGPEEVRLLEELGAWVERELEDSKDDDRAALVQQSLLPRDQPASPGYEIAGVSIPKKIVGGDYYSWHRSEQGLEFTLADVMGKGAGGAIMAATVRAAFLSRSGDGVADAIAGVNAQLLDDLGQTASFATLVHGVIDTDTGRIRYADAGHGLTLIVRADGTAERLEATGLPIGIVTEARWVEREAELTVGESLVLVTDGVLDLYSGALDALDDVAAAVRAADGPQAAVAHFTDLVARGADDDVTVVVITRRA